MFRYQEVEAWDFRCSLYCCFQQVSFLRSKQDFYQSVYSPDMVKALTANNKNGKDEKSSLSSLQTLIVSTATRVGMGNLTGVVAAISAGGAGAVFWMWITALLGSSTAFIEATLAQLHKEKRPPVWWISRRTSLLYSPLYGRETRKEEKTHTDRCLICDFRIDLLVWDQSGGK